MENQENTPAATNPSPPVATPSPTSEPQPTRIVTQAAPSSSNSGKSFIITMVIVTLIVIFVPAAWFGLRNSNKAANDVKSNEFGITAPTETVYIPVDISTGGRKLSSDTADQALLNYGQGLQIAIREDVESTGKLPKLSEIPQLAQIKKEYAKGNGGYYQEALIDGKFEIVNGIPNKNQHFYAVGYICKGHRSKDLPIQKSSSPNTFAIVTRLSSEYSCLSSESIQLKPKTQPIFRRNNSANPTPTN